VELSLKVKRPDRWMPGNPGMNFTEPTARAVRLAGGDISTIYRDEIVAADALATRALWRGVTTLWRGGNADVFREQIRMPGYAVWASEGTGPHWPDMERLAVWAVARGLPPEAVFPIARWISRHGTRAKGFLAAAEAKVVRRAAEIRDRLRDELTRVIGGGGTP
jgi:hypothetical protein